MTLRLATLTRSALRRRTRPLIVATGHVLLIAVVLLVPPGCRDTDTDQVAPVATRQGDSPAAARDSLTIILAADAWPPFNCGREDPREGYMVDIARAIFEPAGFEVEYRIVPWRRALAGTATGVYDGVIAASRTEGPGLVFPRFALLRNSTSFITLGSSAWRFEGAESLRAVRLGAAAGYDYVEWLNAYVAMHAPQHDRVQAISGDDPLTQNLHKLAAGRIDVLVGNFDNIMYRARRMGLAGQLRHAGADTTDSPCFIAFSPATGRGRRMADLFDLGLEQLRASGELAVILDWYSVSDWAPDRHGGRQ